VAPLPRGSAASPGPGWTGAGARRAGPGSPKPGFGPGRAGWPGSGSGAARPGAPQPPPAEAPRAAGRGAGPGRRRGGVPYQTAFLFALGLVPWPAVAGQLSASADRLRVWMPGKPPCG